MKKSYAIVGMTCKSCVDKVQTALENRFRSLSDSINQ